ncbi:hypothetical protein SAMN03097699_0913 [Flavobacteriaceae bacterium MAR_2010_188]|nr:hypothetical protein SAMN03097699_0913 [Flavobacteriaceae bacterium MAR_2010_188]
MSDIKSLVVFPKLMVHNLKVEPKRVKATYTIIKEDGSAVENELIYSYNQVYFNKKNWEDVNLASMMVAQVALNYGLFFEKIELDGIFDTHDKRFLLDMLENTSREIYAIKFLKKNEFLKPPFDSLKPQKLEKYTASELVFINSDFDDLNPGTSEIAVDYNKYAILSSGGKDSLLTYGLIKEIGEAHPIFINEAGRHWFTAVNAHNNFKESEPNTAKPWCNSDRIFNWMVKQMPFIKENFQSIRADIYPIRLWTVSVFLFGVLPIARKKGLGNILIGNEYDTTVKGNIEGITHYNAIYDQSKYFDNALSRYYQKKGWDIYQYSILRSLSELLILKILVKRYPDLQKLQVSCHAAHEEDGKMLPCGNCEKCRRIVGMLKALDEDPKRCGYTDNQIEKCLVALSKQSVKQIGSDAAQLYYLLDQRDLLQENEHTNKLAKEHPEITKLRFDIERSNLEDLPKHIRKPLFKIYQKYSDGVVKLSERKWHNFDLDKEIENIPYFLNKKNGHTI